MSDDAPLTLPTIAFLGAGSMARAILTGLLQPGIEIDGGIRATNRSPERAAELDGLPGVTSYATETDAAANRTAVAGAKIVVVAVKPAMVPDLLREIADALEPGTIVVSVAAGVTVTTFESLLPESVAVIRSMPNTPAVVGRAVTGVSAGTRSTAEDLALAVQLFETNWRSPIGAAGRGGRPDPGMPHRAAEPEARRTRLSYRCVAAHRSSR